MKNWNEWENRKYTKYSARFPKTLSRKTKKQEDQENPSRIVRPFVEERLLDNREHTLDLIIPRLEAELEFLEQDEDLWKQELALARQDYTDAQLFIKVIDKHFSRNKDLAYLDDQRFPFYVRTKAGRRRYNFDLDDGSWVRGNKPYRGRKEYDFLVDHLWNIHRGRYTAIPMRRVELLHQKGISTGERYTDGKPLSPVAAQE